ncbi:MAG: aminotransferase class I/II-fold pyridoxal phosphate-dependent enzyme [Flavobacteriia bacterium]
MDAKLLDKLKARKQEGTLRSLSCLEGMIDFYSNDYLGLSKQLNALPHSIKGSTGSRLISGNSIEAEQCETFLADYFGVESTLVFNSGYDANLGFFSSVPQKGDTIIYDQFVHASVRDGIRMSNAKAYSFEHNSTEDLEKKIRRAEGAVYVAVESLYSMDGDLAPLKRIAEICVKFGVYLIVDEAHACGVFGKGLVVELGVNDKVFARLVTFGKAFGCHGAAILGPLNLKEFLINFARSFIYTTALPPSAYTLIQQSCSLDFDLLQLKLHANIRLFRSNLGHFNFKSDARSPIQIVTFCSIEKTKRIAEEIQKKGFAVKPIYSPTVAKGEECIRICLHAFNSAEEIEELCTLLKEL